MLRVAGASLDAIAVKYDVKRDAIWRHMQKHVSDAARSLHLSGVPIAEMAEKAAKEGTSLLNYFGLLRSVVIQQMMLAASINDGHRTAVLAGRAVEVLREIGRLTGELSKIGNLTVNNNATIFMNSPLFADLEAMLLDRLRAYPEALRAVVDGLRELDVKLAPSDDDGSPRSMTIDLTASEVAHVAAV